MASTLVLQQRLVHTIQLATFAYFWIFFADPCQPFSLANPKTAALATVLVAGPPKENPTDASVEDAFAEDTGHFEKTHRDLYIYIYYIGTSQTLLKTEF